MVAINAPQQGLNLVVAPTGCSIFSESPFKIKNSLCDHPLFENERLKRLLRKLPRNQVEIRAVQSLDTNDGSYRRGELISDTDPVEAFERLSEQPTWMLLHETYIHDPEYAEFMRQYLDQLRASVPDIGDDIYDLGCWLFFSSGRCVVHFHSDPDQSFLNQIRGSKTIFVYPAKVLPESAVENLVYSGNQDAVVYRPEYEASMFPPTDLNPGESVFLPLFAPHRVINNDEVCISINVGFHTKKSRRRKLIHIVNREMRHLGLNPSPYNFNALSDSIKEQMHLAVRAKNKFLKVTGLHLENL